MLIIIINKIFMINLIINLQILNSIMGCCESKLLGIQGNSQKYQTGPIQLNENYNPNKKNMVTINLPGHQYSQERSSLCSLKSGLQIMLKQFENSKGPITCTFLTRRKMCQKSNIAEIPNINGQELRNSIQENIKNHRDQYFQYQNNSQSNISQLQDQPSCYQQQNTKIISQASLSTKRQLQKQLFYINTSFIGQIRFMKWTQDNRLSVIFNEKQLIKGVTLHDFHLFVALLQVFYYEERNMVKLFAYKQLIDGLGYRVYVNGIKRMVKIKKQHNPNEKLLSLLPKMLNPAIDNNISLWIYVTIGWIPQIISLQQFTNMDEILRRLVKNYHNSNIIIGFTNPNRQSFVTVKNINESQKTMNVITLTKGQPCNQDNHSYECSWGQICRDYPILYVNWNPFIYSFNKKVQGTFTCKFQNDTKTWNKLKYLIKIPPSKSQVQVRIFGQIHYTAPNDSFDGFQILLYENQSRQLNIEQKFEPIRQLKPLNRHFLSEIFLFQRSEQYGYYTIVVKINQKYNKTDMIDSHNICPDEQNVQLTLQFYTFCQIIVKALKQPELIYKNLIKSPITIANIGFGMNSPFFNKNKQYSLKLKLNNVCRLEVRAQTTRPFIFQICVLPDNYKFGDITLIRPQELVKQVIQSQEFQNFGSLEFHAKKQNYIVMIVAFTPTQGQIIINSQFYSLQDPQINQIISGEIQQTYDIRQINQTASFMKEISFEWSTSSPGPRKRTKTNSEIKFYPVDTFQRYFQNPYIDQVLPKGVYQFTIFSKSFSDQYKESELLQNEQLALQKYVESNPPSLSMGIFLLNNDLTQVKIVLDDVQYVPYGIGFWASPMELEGNYRFVFSKIEKGYQEGVFRIRKMCKNNFF